jgi:hypothetical protein
MPWATELHGFDIRAAIMNERMLSPLYLLSIFFLSSIVEHNFYVDTCIPPLHTTTFSSFNISTTTVNEKMQFYLECILTRG